MHSHYGYPALKSSSSSASLKEVAFSAYYLEQVNSSLVNRFQLESRILTETDSVKSLVINELGRLRASAASVSLDMRIRHSSVYVFI